MIYVTSDLHGYPLDEFLKFLDRVGFSQSDQLYVLGDVIDRGADGVRILQWMMDRENVKLILGNHEDMLLDCAFLFDNVTKETVERVKANDMINLEKWQINGAEYTIRGFLDLPPEERLNILNYVKKAPLYLPISVGGRDFLLVHAGLGMFSGVKEKITDYGKSELLWDRPALDTDYSDGFITVFGHTPTGYYNKEYSGRALKTKTWINIDTGAAQGKHPMLLRLDDLKEFYVE